MLAAAAKNKDIREKADRHIKQFDTNLPLVAKDAYG